MNDAEGVRTSISDLRTETTRYFNAAQTIDTMPAMDAEMEHHVGIAMPMLSDMHSNMQDMDSHCGPMTGMFDMHDEMMREMSSHQSMILDASSITAAMAEVERHTSAMNNELAQMNQMMGMMPCR